MRRALGLVVLLGAGCDDTCTIDVELDALEVAVPHQPGSWEVDVIGDRWKGGCRFEVPRDPEHEDCDQGIQVRFAGGIRVAKLAFPEDLARVRVRRDGEVQYDQVIEPRDFYVIDPIDACADVRLARVVWNRPE